MKTRASLAALALSLFASGPAFAQQQPSNSSGFALDRFDPSERGSDWFANESLDLRGSVRPAIGVVADWGRKPLVLYNPDGSRLGNLVSDQVYLHAGASVVLADRFRLGLNLPILAFQHGATLVGFAGNLNTKAPSSAGVGDLRFGGDVRLFGRYGDPITGAVGVQLYFPTGSREDYTGDGTLRVKPRAMVAGDVGVVTYAAQLAFHVRPYDERLAGSQLGSEFDFGLAAGLKIKERLVVGPELYGSTVVNGDNGAFQKRNTPIEGLLGGHLGLGDSFRIGAGVGPGFTRGYGEPEVRVVGSLEWFPCADSDGDGVCDGKDACPDVAGVGSDKPEKNGCPSDRDEDGILDKVDACPDAAGPRTNDPRTNGCPDRDHDGVADREDTCPDVPGVRTDDPKTNGCPPDKDGDGVWDKDDACPEVPGIKTDDPKTNGCPPDKDHDGVWDKDDACPDVPGVKTDDPKTNGCPPDRDHDGILDQDDACPDQAGEPNPDPKKNGCPKAIVEGKQIKITEQIKFRFDKSEIDPASDPILEAVAKILVEHPEMNLKVEGHTDNKGSAAYNLNLSKQRAAAVKKWLGTHGVDPKRLSSEGYGSARPIEPNDTEDGRRNNRRVEFHILDSTGATGGAAPAPTPTPAPAPKTP